MEASGSRSFTVAGCGLWLWFTGKLSALGNVKIAAAAALLFEPRAKW
jgi:hypothetical protein